MTRALALGLLLGLLVSCASRPQAARGIIDLRDYQWSHGTLALSGEWAFREGWRSVPDSWSGTEAGGHDGRGSGAYRLKILLPSGSPALALRFKTASTALSVRVGGVELARAGNPDADPARAVSGYAPAAVPLPRGDEIDLEIFVSNHVYRVGGLWDTPTIGPLNAVIQSKWLDEAAAVALAAALAIIGLAAALLFLYRHSGKTFLHLGIFALLVAVRSLVTGDYTLVRIFPDIPFDLVIRVEYLTVFLPVASAFLFFTEFFPGLAPQWALRAVTWPSWLLGICALVLPLEWLTRTILWYYPLVIPAVLIGIYLVFKRILADSQGVMLFVGAAILAGSGLSDMITAALFTTTGTLTPWGLGIFAVLQATTLARRFLSTYDAKETLLAEKELLVKEVHHRVKNSLQVVASIVSLQSNRTENAAQKAVFRALRQRITAVSLVHEKLYGQKQGDRPDVGEYLTDLLKLQYPGDGLASGVHWTISADSLSAGVDYCIDVGLIVTELVGNAHKHALLQRGGNLEISVKIRESRLEIDVSDDGPGFGPDFAPEASKGLGFRLVLALMQRNDGRLTWQPGPGARVHVDLKLPGD